MKIILISFLLLLRCIYTCSSSPISNSDGIFTSEASIGRNLLQTKKPCPVNFEFANYTIITSRCRGPDYPSKPCCDAFKEFACPYRNDLNDLTNDCSSTMLAYIESYGNYTTGLFASICRDDINGLICPAVPPTAEGNNVGTDSNKSHNIHTLSIITLTVVIMTFFLCI